MLVFGFVLFAPIVRFTRTYVQLNNLRALRSTKLNLLTRSTQS